MIKSKAWQPVKALAECPEPGVHFLPSDGMLKSKPWPSYSSMGQCTEEAGAGRPRYWKNKLWPKQLVHPWF